MQSRSIIVVAALLSVGLAGEQHQPLRLEQVISAALATAKMGEARLELAKSNLRYLEALNKTRIELRPTLGIFAFSSPALLATNLGSGLLFNRRTAPGPAAMDNARFDALAAELSSESAKVRVQLDATRAFFDLLGKQKIAALAAQALSHRRTRRGEIDQFLEASRITTVDQLAWEQELIDSESAWLNAECDRKSSATRLGVLIGQTSEAAGLVVAEPDFSQVDGGNTIPDLERLVTLAVQRRSESKLMNDKLIALRDTGKAPRKVSIDTLNTGYGYISNKAGISNALTSGVLGGNTGRGELTLNIPLRDNGEKPAHDAVTAARTKLLELEMSALEESMRVELADLRDAAAASIERVRLASKRLELARRAAQVIQARVENGLAALPANWSADQAVLIAESAYMEAEYERRFRLYALTVVCGLDRPSELSAEARTE